MGAGRGRPVDPWYTATVADIPQMRQRLLDAVGADGGWAYYPDKASRIEPTAWALLALGVTGQDEPTRQAALDWLASLRHQNGLLVDPGATHPNAAWNGVALLMLAGLEDPAAAALAGRIADGLLQIKGIALRPDPTVRQDNTLQAWSWMEGTFSWVEPTAWCLLGLKKYAVAGRSALFEARVQEAERLVIDRACQPAGWNYGNGAVLDQDLRPYVPTTALALLALQDHPDEPVVTRGIEWLAEHSLSEPSAMALGLASLSLGVFGRPIDEPLAQLANLEGRTAFLENAHLLSIALLAMTLPAHGGRPFRV